ncbi:MAG: hypothetical protein U0Y08_14400 [Bacteroidia bacterium]
MMRFPFVSNKYFRLIISLLAAVIIVKMLLHPDKNEKMQYFILAIAAVIFVRGIYLFIRSGNNSQE